MFLMHFNHSHVHFENFNYFFLLISSRENKKIFLTQLHSFQNFQSLFKKSKFKSMLSMYFGH